MKQNERLGAHPRQFLKLRGGVTRLPLLLLFTLFLSVIGSQGNTALAMTPKKDPLKIVTLPSLDQLIEKSDVIVQGRLEPAVQTYKLGKHVHSFEIVNTIQVITIEKTFKGHPQSKIKLLITGLTPLPNAKSPLNLKYPGELAEGDYIFFLKQLPNTPYYQLTSGMQSVYPIIYGRTIALKDVSSFKELDKLTPSAFKKIIKSKQ